MFMVLTVFFPHYNVKLPLCYEVRCFTVLRYNLIFPLKQDKLEMIEGRGVRQKIYVTADVQKKKPSLAGQILHY